MVLAAVFFAASCASNESSSSEDGGGGTGNSDEDAGPPQMGGKVVYGLEAETTNGWCLPEGQLAISGIMVARALYDTLTVPDGDGNFVPFLAESVEPNDDYTEWTIKVRDGVKFSDGSDLTSEVVKNNLDAYRNQYPGRTSLLFQFVLQDITDVSVVDPLSVKVTTGRPWASFPSFLYSSGRMGMVGQAQLDDAEGCARNLIGTGPFILEDWQVNSSLTAKKNPNYWREDADGNQLPYLDEIEFRPITEAQQRLNALESGEIDAFHTTDIATIEELRNQSDDGQVNLTESDDNAEVGNLMLNATEPPFDNQIARQAAATAIDRDEINQILNKGIPKIANGPFSPGTIGYTEDTGYPDYDVDKAKQLVQQYESETGQQFQVQISSPPDPETRQLVDLTAQYFEDAGMKVTTTTFDQSELIQTAIQRDYQAITWRNYPGLDPDGNYVWWYGKGNPVNFMGFDDSTVNDLLDQGRATADPDERQQIYADLNKHFAEQDYMLWASWTQWDIPTDSEVHGVVGARPPDDEGSDYTGLALGNDMALMWREQ
ncbi:MAG TPA: ABC transporter substrate-binding protein [Acidimicrobiales bacterium]|nr:ABC transporter substrate-binding protein [Acidimicrobiales bacterium]